MYLMMVLSLICSNGCSLAKNIKQDDPLRLLYDQETYKASDSREDIKNNSPKLTLSANRMPFSVLTRILSDKFLVGLVFSEKLLDKTITAEFKDTAFEDVLNVISRQLDTDIVHVGNTYYIGPLRNEDRGILVRRIIGYSVSELKSAMDAALSEKGKSSVMGQGVISVVDHQSVLRRISELLDYLDHLDQPVWIVQLAFIAIQKDAAAEMGMKVTTSGTLSYNISENKLDLKDFKIDGLINQAMSSNFADVYSSPMLLIREGSESSWKYGRRVPVPKKTTSSYGVVTTTGFDYVDVGFNVKASINSSRVGGLLKIEISKSEIESYVEYAPVTVQNVYSFTADLKPLAPYLLGELQMFKDMDKQSDTLNIGKEKGKSVVQLWGQIYRITPGVHAKFPDSEVQKIRDNAEKERLQAQLKYLRELDKANNLRKQHAAEAADIGKNLRNQKSDRPDQINGKAKNLRKKIVIPDYLLSDEYKKKTKK